MLGICPRSKTDLRAGIQGLTDHQKPSFCLYCTMILARMGEPERRRLPFNDVTRMRRSKDNLHPWVASIITSA